MDPRHVVGQVRRWVLLGRRALEIAGLEGAEVLEDTAEVVCGGEREGEMGKARGIREPSEVNARFEG